MELPAPRPGTAPVVKKVIMEQSSPDKLLQVGAKPQGVGNPEGMKGHGHRMVRNTGVMVHDSSETLEIGAYKYGLSKFVKGGVFGYEPIRLGLPVHGL